MSLVYLHLLFVCFRLLVGYCVAFDRCFRCAVCFVCCGFTLDLGVVGSV